MHKTLRSPKQLINSTILEWINYKRQIPVSSIKQLSDISLFVPILSIIHSFKIEILEDYNGTKLQMRLKYLNIILSGIKKVLEFNKTKIKDEIEFDLSLLEVCNGSERQLILFVGLVLSAFLCSNSKGILIEVVRKLSELAQTTFMIIIEDALSLIEGIYNMDRITQQDSQSFFRELTFQQTMNQEQLKQNKLKTQQIDDRIFQYSQTLNKLRQANAHLRRQNTWLNKKWIETDIILQRTVKDKDKKIMILHTQNRMMGKDLMNSQRQNEKLRQKSKRSSLNTSVTRDQSQQNKSVRYSTGKQANVLPIIKQRLSLRKLSKR